MNNPIQILEERVDELEIQIQALKNPADYEQVFGKN